MKKWGKMSVIFKFTILKLGFISVFMQIWGKINSFLTDF